MGVTLFSSAFWEVNGTDLSSFVTDITPNYGSEMLDATAMGDSYSTKLSDFPDFEISVQVFDDRLTDALQIVNDGVDRLFVTCYDTTATTKKGYTGLGQCSWSPSAKVRAVVGGQLTITSSDGNPTPYFAASIPDPT